MSSRSRRKLGGRFFYLAICGALSMLPFAVQAQDGDGPALSGPSLAAPASAAADAVPPPPTPELPGATADTAPTLLPGDSATLKSGTATPQLLPNSAHAGEVQTRGPVHEAFAEPIEGNPSRGLTVPKAPPKPIDEIPPDEKPVGDNIVWIPGYWSWDDDRKDFLWISGVYRAVPPGRTFVSGYWHQQGTDWAWVPGFWTSTKTDQVSYLQQPPQTLEVGPSSAAPGPDYFWVSGSWVYRDRYAWRPGYWARGQADWIWTPAHYRWTPSGYVFIDGYWDYPLVRRGVLFAPVYYAQPVYLQPAFVYTPAVVINTDILTVNMFCRPRYCHYYFGDYYAPSYAAVGIRPWFSVGVGFGGGVSVGVGFGDPLFAYYRWQHVHYHNDPHWVAHLENRYDRLRGNPADRPPRTFAAQQQFVNSRGHSQNVQIRDSVIAAPLNQVVNNTTINNNTINNNIRGGNRVDNSVSNNFKFTKIDKSEQQQLRRTGVDAQQAAIAGRQKFEGGAGGAAGTRNGRGDFTGGNGQRDFNQRGSGQSGSGSRGFKLPEATLAGSATTGSASGDSSGTGNSRRRGGGNGGSSATSGGNLSQPLSIDRSSRQGGSRDFNQRNGSSNQLGNGQLGTGQVGNGQSDAGQSGGRQFNGGQRGSGQTGGGQRSSRQSNSSQLGNGQLGTGQTGNGLGSADQNDGRQFSSGQRSLGQTGGGQGGTGPSNFVPRSGFIPGAMGSGSPAGPGGITGPTGTPAGGQPLTIDRSQRTKSSTGQQIYDPNNSGGNVGQGAFGGGQGGVGGNYRQYDRQNSGGGGGRSRGDGGGGGGGGRNR